MRIFACVCLAALAASFSRPAGAAPMACSPRDDVLAQLATKFKEVPASEGLSNGGGIIEVIRTADGATWTITITMPNGETCLVAAGENWRDHENVAFPGAEVPL